MDGRNPRRPWQKRALNPRFLVSARLHDCWCYTKRASTIPRAHESDVRRVLFSDPLLVSGCRCYLPPPVRQDLELPPQHSGRLSMSLRLALLVHGRRSDPAEQKGPHSMRQTNDVRLIKAVDCPARDLG